MHVLVDEMMNVGRRFQDVKTMTLMLILSLKFPLGTTLSLGDIVNVVLKPSVKIKD